MDPWKTERELLLNFVVGLVVVSLIFGFIFLIIFLINNYPVFLLTFIALIFITVLGGAIRS